MCCGQSQTLFIAKKFRQKRTENEKVTVAFDMSMGGQWKIKGGLWGSCEVMQGYWEVSGSLEWSLTIDTGTSLAMISEI